MVKVLRRSRGIESPVIPLDEFFRLDEWLPSDAAAHRRFALDPDAARFFGWTVEQAASAPDSHYDEVIARFAREWHKGTRFSIAIRRCSDGEAVGLVELGPTGSEADVSYMVAPEGARPRPCFTCSRGADRLGNARAWTAALQPRVSHRQHRLPAGR